MFGLKNLSKAGKCFFIWSAVALILTIIFLVMLFLKPHFSTLVDNLVHDEVKFTADNSDVWGEFPGKNDIIIVNNITFLHHRNLNEGTSIEGL